jgi:chromosomal replication initiator protein
VAGVENALLRVLLPCVSEETPRYNPITLYGPSGTGKSHLLAGLVDRLSVSVPQPKVWATTGADFARLYARAIELDSLPELRDRTQSLQWLVVDGLDELATKPAAQQELQQIVDDCLDRGCRLLTSSREPPTRWTWMSAGLRSRLEGGLTIPLALPEHATREEIVRRVAADLGVKLDEATLSRLAGTDSRAGLGLLTFPQLTGAVLQWASSADNESAGIAQDCADHGAQARRDVIRQLSRIVAQHFRLKVSELQGKSRRKSVVEARGIAIYLARSLVGASFNQIGSNFGDRDHTTVLHAFHKVDEALQTNLVLKQTVERLCVEFQTSHAATTSAWQFQRAGLRGKPVHRLNENANRKRSDPTSRPELPAGGEFMNDGTTV